MAKAKFKYPILCLLVFLITEVAKAETYDTSQIPQPRNGDIVCQAYISEYSPFGNRLAGDLQFITNLPEFYCRNGRALDGSTISFIGRRLRVVAVGDFYQYSDDEPAVHAETVNPDYSEVACRARAYTPEGDRVSLHHLNETDCYSGATFRISLNGTVRWVMIETVYDFHYVPTNEIQVAEPVEDSNSPYQDEGSKEEFIPAVHTVEI